MTKSKTTQPVTTNVVQGRDLFQTPNYATRLLTPFIPEGIRIIWEPACGNYKIFDVLVMETEATIFGTDLSWENGENFLTDTYKNYNFDCIITNPPFSLKRKFFEKCIELDVPFALLIPADYCMWTIEAITKYGCEKIIPTRRIDYITPTGKSGLTGQSSNFHSLWLTRGFNLGQSETFAELTSEMKKDV